MKVRIGARRIGDAGVVRVKALLDAGGDQDVALVVAAENGHAKTVAALRKWIRREGRASGTEGKTGAVPKGKEIKALQ